MTRWKIKKQTVYAVYVDEEFEGSYSTKQEAEEVARDIVKHTPRNAAIAKFGMRWADD